MNWINSKFSGSTKNIRFNFANISEKRNMEERYLESQLSPIQTWSVEGVSLIYLLSEGQMQKFPWQPEHNPSRDVSSFFIFKYIKKNSTDFVLL
jgi:hypothetical protein